MADARSVALEVLRRLRRDEVYVNLALSAELERARLADADRALATELVYGVLRRRARLDHALAQHAKRPITRTKADVLDVMRLVAYQLLALDRVPAHAAVSEAVEQVRRARGPRVAGFVNAVLRRLAEAASADREAAWGPLPEARRARLALEHSLPDELLALLADRLDGDDDELDALARALSLAPALSLRANPARITRDALAARLEEEAGTRARVERCERSPWGLRVSGLSDPFHRASYLEGLWTAQDEAAQLAVAALEPSASDVHRVLDACAGVGGKATLLAALLPERGQLLAA
ncbi:MAG: SAM-dependent methyltransferase, partial [Myxococcales bacterium]|nr:SAM-dependent methyltransferase [Myxococcales bacterium]